MLALRHYVSCWHFLTLAYWRNFNGRLLLLLLLLDRGFPTDSTYIVFLFRCLIFILLLMRRLNRLLLLLLSIRLDLLLFGLLLQSWLLFSLFEIVRNMASFYSSKRRLNRLLLHRFHEGLLSARIITLFLLLYFALGRLLLLLLSRWLRLSTGRGIWL